MKLDNGNQDNGIHYSNIFGKNHSVFQAFGEQNDSSSKEIAHFLRQAKTRFQDFFLEIADLVPSLIAFLFMTFLAVVCTFEEEENDFCDPNEATE